MYYVYVLKNKEDKYYIGYTIDVLKRLKKHNAGGSIWTRNRRPWQVVYTEKFMTKKEALQREKQVKSFKGGNKFKELISTVS